MGELSPELQNLLEQARQAALSNEDAEEYFPWGNRAFFREIKGRNFLFIGDKNDYLEISFRLPAGQKEEALSQPFVENNKWMDQMGWLTARIKTQEELDTVVPWIKVSYQLAKPFRSKDEILPGESPLILDFLEQVRQVALSYGDIEEYFPYGDRAFRRRKGQIFLYVNEADEALHVSVRLPWLERDYAIGLPFVSIPKYIGPRGWVSARVSTREELDMVLPWIESSYNMNQPARKSKAKK